jgi:hydrogenase maturation factor
VSLDDAPKMLQAMHEQQVEAAIIGSIEEGNGTIIVE